MFFLNLQNHGLRKKVYLGSRYIKKVKEISVNVTQLSVNVNSVT